MLERIEAAAGDLQRAVARLGEAGAAATGIIEDARPGIQTIIGNARPGLEAILEPAWARRLLAADLAARRVLR